MNTVYQYGVTSFEIPHVFGLSHGPYGKALVLMYYRKRLSLRQLLAITLNPAVN